jgi:hypothetical protein
MAGIRNEVTHVCAAVVRLVSPRHVAIDWLRLVIDSSLIPRTFAALERVISAIRRKTPPAAWASSPVWLGFLLFERNAGASLHPACPMAFGVIKTTASSGRTVADVRGLGGLRGSDDFCHARA